MILRTQRLGPHARTQTNITSKLKLSPVTRAADMLRFVVPSSHPRVAGSLAAWRCTAGVPMAPGAVPSAHHYTHARHTERKACVQLAGAPSAATAALAHSRSLRHTTRKQTPIHTSAHRDDPPHAGPATHATQRQPKDGTSTDHKRPTAVDDSTAGRRTPL